MVGVHAVTPELHLLPPVLFKELAVKELRNEYLGIWLLCAAGFSVCVFIKPARLWPRWFPLPVLQQKYIYNFLPLGKRKHQSDKKTLSSPQIVKTVLCRLLSSVTVKSKTWRLPFLTASKINGVKKEGKYVKKNVRVSINIHECCSSSVQQFPLSIN